MKLNQYMEMAQQAVAAGRGVLLEKFGHLSQIEQKERAGLVTEADREAEAAILNLLPQTPEFSFLAEESGEAGDRSEAVGRWVLDPLDGTTNYVHRHPFFAISLALELNGELVLGVVDCPLLGKNYSALKDEGAYLNGERISVSGTESLMDGLFATGFAGSDREGFRDQIQAVERIVKCTRGVRRCGAAAIDLCLVAEGIYDGFWEEGLSPWDVAAGAIVVREAGGSVTGFSGEEFSLDGGTIIATNGRFHQRLIETLRST